MKLMICGKGGSGKSTVSVLLAREMDRLGFRVLLVDADESNIGLYRMLGVSMPETLMAGMGGKKGFQSRLKAAGQGLMAGPPLFGPGTDMDCLPGECLARTGNIRVVSTGKIEHFGEGCACPMGSLFRALVPSLELSGRDLILVDTAAGLEHFGRRLDSQCDHLASVVSPSFESVTMATRMAGIAHEAGLPFSVILNNIPGEALPGVTSALEGLDILGNIPGSPEVFTATLKGEALGDPALPGLTDLARAVSILMSEK